MADPPASLEDAGQVKGERFLRLAWLALGAAVRVAFVVACGVLLNIAGMAVVGVRHVPACLSMLA